MIHIFHKWKQLSKTCPVESEKIEEMPIDVQAGYEYGTVRFNQYSTRYVQVCTKCDIVMKCPNCDGTNIKDECAYGSDSDYVCQDCKFLEKLHWEKKTNELIKCPTAIPSGENNP